MSNTNNTNTAIDPNDINPVGTDVIGTDAIDPDMADDQFDNFGFANTMPLGKHNAMAYSALKYLENATIDCYTDPREVANGILQTIQTDFESYNTHAPKTRKLKLPTDLTPSLIAKAMLHMYTIRNINCAGENFEKDYDVLGIYQEDGENKGIYVSDEKMIHHMISTFHDGVTSLEISETVKILMREAPRVERCNDRDLIAVNNGIFNYKTKILEPFDPEKVFTAKCRVDYNPIAQNITIHNDEDNTDWNVEDWIKDLFDDPEIAESIWQIMGAVIRPNVRWGKAAWFVSEKGNNGKGTLCQLMRNLAGHSSYTAIQLADFGKDFMLEPLIRATSIITDENDVGTFIDKAANMKAIITNDVIQVNRKFKTPIAYQFKGFMVQCINELPRTKDKSESFYRRQIFIPFTKCYTGIERKYIKNDYLNRKDVLEYVLYRILNMNYYEITVPESCTKALNDYKTFNDPVRDFIIEITEEASWDTFPSNLLFLMYKNWTRINNPNGSVQGRNTFLNDVANLMTTLDIGWEYHSENKRVGNGMNCDEPLLNKYDCKEWMINPSSKDLKDRINTNRHIVMTRGLFRVKTNNTATTAANTDASDSSND